MKHTNFLLALTAATALLFACESPETPVQTPSISVDQTALSFDENGGAGAAQTILLTVNRSWTATCDSDWVIISPASGDAAEDGVAVSIYCEANTTTDRTTTVKFATSTVSTTVSISQSGPDGEAGTYDNPYTVEQALAIINNGSYTSSNVYIHGLISQIDEISTSYGNATYYISDDGTTTSQLEVYHGYYIDGAKFTSEDQLAVGDEVIVCGQLTLYYSTPEVTSYSTLYMHNGVYGTPEESGDLAAEEGDGSLSNPYNVSAAISASIATGTTASDAVYVKGIISKISEVSTSYGNASFYISDDGSTANQFLIYRAYSLGGAKFTSEDEIAVGDEVIMYGSLIYYNSSTPEMTQGGYIYSLNGSASDSGSDSDSSSDEATGDGTADNPYNPAGAEAAAIAQGSTASTDSYYVKGIISSITELSTSYGNATFYLSEDGSTSGTQFLIYRAYSLNGEKFTSSTEIEVGDEVVVYGKLIYYYSNTPEMTQGGYLISITKGDGSVSSGDSSDDDTSDDTTADDATGVTYTKTSNTLVTIANNDVTASGATLSYSFADAGWDNATSLTDQSVTLSDGTVITWAQNTGNNAPAYYTSGSAIRMYPMNSMTVACTSELAKIELTCVSTYVGNDLANATVSGNTWTIANDYTATSGGTQLRVVTITLYYAGEPAEGSTDDSTTGDENTGDENTDDNTGNNDSSSTDGVSTVAEVLAGTDGNYYTVTGVCTSVTSTYYGNWYLQDETGSILIYGTVDASGSYVWSSLGIEVGDTVTVYGARTTYNTTVELKNVIVTNIEKAESSSDDDSTTTDAKGTINNPYTVAEALAIINAGSYTSSNVYVSGIISSIKSYNSSYSSISYYISDDGTSTDTIYVYSGLGLNQAKFTDSSDLSVGAKVVICGVLTMYYSTPEINYNNYLVSYEE